MSDDLGEARAVQTIPAGTRAVDFLTAGGDLVTSQDLAPAQEMAAAVLAKAQGSAAFRGTVDDAARRVLTAKRAACELPLLISRAGIPVRYPLSGGIAGRERGSNTSLRRASSRTVPGWTPLSARTVDPPPMASITRRT